MDGRDWFIVVLIVAVLAVATVFVWKHPTDLNFATWATLCGTMTGFYHYQNVKDDKTPDAAPGAQQPCSPS